MELYGIRGRGAATNPANRFERLQVVLDPGARDADDPGPRTVFLRDASRSVIARNRSPDVGFEFSVNPYRGCEHGCAYCYARPTHEYLGLSAGLDFETKILVKEDAPVLLRRALASPRWRPAPIALSGVTDPYQPVERRLRLTRGCLAVLAEARNPVAIITKNCLVTRDIDLLGELARHDAAAVSLSLTTLDPALQRAMEPRTSVPARRLAAIETLARAGIPVGVMTAPVIPGLNDHELPELLRAAAEAGARWAAYVPLRLPLAVAPLFEDWLVRHYPERKAKVLGRLREMRGGKLNDARFGHRMRGHGPYAEQIRALFHAVCRRAGLSHARFPLSTAAFRRPAPPAAHAAADAQLGLFDAAGA
jgi:DNA repair photolyase